MRIAAALAMLALVLAAATVPAAPGASGAVLEVRSAVDRSCTRTPLSGAGVAAREVRAPVTGLISAELSAANGDWDLGVFDRSSGATVAGSAQAGGEEVAEGIVLAGEQLVVQACRRRGSDPTARLSLDWKAVDTTAAETASLVRVSTPTRESEQRLTGLGLDRTEHGGPGFVDVVLHGDDDARALSASGLAFTTVVADLSRQSAAHRRADARYAAGTERSRLPSGRTTYRRLFHYSEELKKLARNNPNLVRHFTLPFETYEGRKVEGIEISRGVGRRDGKPVFLIMGLHHAREWPSGEHTIEWAYELLRGFRSGNRVLRNLVTHTRTIVIPVVNPDGFNASREAGQMQGGGGGRGGSDAQETANIVAHPNEYRRKNCRYLDDRKGGDCNQGSAGLAEPGVDPNRNYGGFWGGPGASEDPTAQDYRGPGPFSEPETRNIRWLVSRRQVAVLITNHTFSNLILRPPGIQTLGVTPDEKIYKRLGRRMADENGYKNQHGYQLYDTSGTTEDWTYYATGGLGFTFEIGPTNFHPPFADMVAEWEGTTEAAGEEGDGNRAAYLIAHRFAANASRHSLLKGTAPPGSTLRLTKTFRTPTSVDTKLRDRLTTLLRVPPSGRFVWHINPSTRPLVAKDRGRPATGPPSPPQSFSGAPGPSAQPCADFDTTDETCWNDHAFTVPAGGDVDNAKATIRLEWPSPTSDWDFKVFRDSDGDGRSVNEGDPIGSGAQGNTNFEETTVSEPVLQPGGRYVIRVINFAAAEPYDGTITFRGPDPPVKGKKESWKLACLRAGDVLATRGVFIERGQRRTLGLRADCAR